MNELEEKKEKMRKSQVEFIGYRKGCEGLSFGGQIFFERFLKT